MIRAATSNNNNNRFVFGQNNSFTNENLSNGSVNSNPYARPPRIGRVYDWADRNARRRERRLNNQHQDEFHHNNIPVLPSHRVYNTVERNARQREKRRGKKMIILQEWDTDHPCEQ